MTLGEYAIYTNVHRQTIYKKFERVKKLAGVIKVQRTEGGITILTVDKEKVK